MINHVQFYHLTKLQYFISTRTFLFFCCCKGLIPFHGILRLSQKNVLVCFRSLLGVSIFNFPILTSDFHRSMKSDVGVWISISWIPSSQRQDQMMQKVVLQLFYHRFLLRFSLVNTHERVVLFPVKLWSTNLDNSVASIEAKANVCCVKFSPTSRYHLAFGCAGTGLFFAHQSIYIIYLNVSFKSFLTSRPV